MIDLIRLLNRVTISDGTLKQERCHPQVGVCCYTKNNMPWICCQAFHIFTCACTRYDKLETQSIHMGVVHPTLGYPVCRTRFGKNCKNTMPSSGWCILLHK